jgi:hypothetical protein
LLNLPLNELKVYALCRYAAESSLYSPWLGLLRYGVELVTGDVADWVAPVDAGLVVAHDHFRWEEIHTLRRIYEQRRVPILLLADGILEYRNTWQNPTISDGSMYMPLMGDKIACIGDASARMIETWGNRGKTEVIGFPRLDPLLNVGSLPGRSSEFRLLIATASTPAFDERQRDLVRSSLQAVKQFCESNAKIAGRDFQVEWRLTDGLETEIGIKPSGKGDEIPSLAQAINECDGVITTPSTIYLESALLGRPTAVIDFTNSPQFLPSAWTITVAEHLQNVLGELANPPAAKMLFQQHVLRDNLRTDSPAAPRMAELVHRIMEISYRQRLRGEELSLPARVMPVPEETQAAALATAGLFPSNDVFQVQVVSRLQAELAQAIHRLGTLPRELADKNNQITNLQLALDESRRRLADVRSRLFKLRKILGIGKENQGSGEDDA